MHVSGPERPLGRTSGVWSTTAKSLYCKDLASGTYFAPVVGLEYQEHPEAHMLPAILLPLLAVSAPHPVPSVGLPLADPPVKVWLNDDRFVRGDRARVYVKTDRDGSV